MITIDNKQYRNLEEQVKKNKDDIQYILEEEGVLNEFGIKVVGEVDTAGDLPDPTTYEGEFGDAYAVGTTTPYELYIYTRASGSHATNYWFNIGQFPAPSTVPGPQGPQGVKGDTGTRGSTWTNGTSAPTSTSGYLTNDKYLNTSNGDVYNYTGSTWQLVGNIRGPQGIQGPQGNVGPVGPQGIQGPIGPQGEPGPAFVIAGTVANEGQLPAPSTLADNIAYLVGNDADGYNLYVQLQDTQTWKNIGKIESAEGPQGPIGPQGPQGPQGEKGEPGQDGITPIVSATATVTNTVGTPSVTVTNIGTATEPNFSFSFSNLKGDTPDLSNYATKEQLNQKQDTLVSGTNIKTINGNSLLGSGDLTISGGGGSVELTSERGSNPNLAMSQLGIENIFYNSQVTLGVSATASGTNSIALGCSAEASGGYATVLGGTAIASDAFSTAIGYNAIANGSNALAIGRSAEASGQYAVAIGRKSKASGMNAIAIGRDAKATSDNTIVLGSSAITSLQCQVQTISALSDSRVKEEVALANTAQCLVDVNRLPVSRYKYKDFTGTHLDVHRTGFMADDVEKVFPKSVAIADETFPVLDEEGNKVYEQVVDEEGNPVLDEEGNPVMKERTFVLEDVKSIAMEMAIPTLWGAVQELTKRVESLEAKLSSTHQA